MDKKEYKLICCDMDGTLVRNGLDISEKNIATLKKAMAKGIKLALVTGRSQNSVKYFETIFGQDIYIISSNGAYFNVKNDDQDFIHKVILENDVLEEIFEIGSKYNLEMHFTSNSRLLLSHIISEKHPYSILVKSLSKDYAITIKEKITLKDILENSDDMILKCLLFENEEGNLKKARNEFEKDARLEIVSSGKKNIEIMSKGVSKGASVLKLAHILNIDREEIICIGDNENDISMIEYAGVGVAMGNSIEALKDKADLITDTNLNDGVSKIIEKLIF